MKIQIWNQRIYSEITVTYKKKDEPVPLFLGYNEWEGIKYSPIKSHFSSVTLLDSKFIPTSRRCVLVIEQKIFWKMYGLALKGQEIRCFNEMIKPWV